MKTRSFPVLSFLLLAGAAAFPCSLVHAQGNLPVLDQKKVIPYRIMNNDKLVIAITQEDDLRASTRVDARGNIQLIYLGDLSVYGLTIPEVQRAIENAYREGRILRHPQAIVSVEEYAPRRVSVTGKVKSQGYIDLPIEVAFTVQDAILKAGGFEDTAKGKAVRVLRRLPDGTEKTYEFDIESALKATKGSKNSKTEDNSLILEPGDIVFVPEKLI